ncbi:hypothetical protein AVEN_214651-1 [Araneus ventricosus]|uniref:Uncharacterized protein n=1 Tax=Araneus ventricosus TaxID=182803 RepID=A0A4Y2TJ14_ARAVE|nr:hypothetical protein AVEN_142058-1 [Araneus ventricosus]GBN99108.1 hypothetical protein AVEN_214651-1 [Araneus ventricosus]
MTVTALSIALSSPVFQLARTADETPNSFFALRRRSSFQLPLLIYPSSTGRDVKWNHPVHSVCISSPYRDIEKIVAFSGVFDLSPRSGVEVWPLPAIPYLPL